MYESELTSTAKVANSERISGEENIVSFQITVQNIVLVEIVDTVGDF